MYYHIPIPEYGLVSSLSRVGEKNEATFSAAVNSGLFSALVQVGDVKATFGTTTFTITAICVKMFNSVTAVASDSVEPTSTCARVDSQRRQDAHVTKLKTAFF